MSDLRKAAEQALEALKEAAECVQLNYQPDKIGHDWDAQIEALRQALAQPEQEPLVWMNKYGYVASFQNEEYKDPLYTTPPKREWVGLTDEERFKIAIDTRPYVADTMRAHEEELKRRNT